MLDSLWKRTKALVDHAGKPIVFRADDLDLPTDLRAPGIEGKDEAVTELEWCELCWGDPSTLLTVLLLNDRCGACARDLRQVPVGPGGLTQCPSCGAAWDLAEFREENPHWWRLEWRDRPLLEHTRYPICDARGRVFPCGVKSGRPIGKGARTRGVQLFLAFLCLIPFTCAGQTGAGVALIGTIVILLLASGHVSLFGLFRTEARERAMASLRSDICPCCESPLGKEPARLSGLRVCSRCGGAWHPSGMVDRVDDLRGL